MVYCRKCGTKLEEGMAYCPNCGTPVAVSAQPYQRADHEHHAFGTPFFGTLTIALVAVVVAVAVIIVALLALGLLPVGHMPFVQVGSGHTTTQTIAIADFTSIDASSGFNVQITQGSAYSVKITTDDNLQQYIETYKSGNALVVRVRPATAVTTTTLRAEITMPDLQGVQFSGGTIGSGSGFNLTHNFNVGLSGGSQLTMTGQAASLTALGSGGSNMHLRGFQVGNANVDLSGGSQATINLTGILNANLSGGSHLYYIGENASLGTINTSGGAGISKTT